MKALEEKILKEGTVLPGNVLKVGSFLNQQMDSDFIMEIGKEIARLYEGTGVTRILTIESSGIDACAHGVRKEAQKRQHAESRLYRARLLLHPSRDV